MKRCEHVEDGERCSNPATVKAGKRRRHLCHDHYQQLVRELRELLQLAESRRDIYGPDTAEPRAQHAEDAQ